MFAGHSIACYRPTDKPFERLHGNAWLRSYIKTTRGKTTTRSMIVRKRGQRGLAVLCQSAYIATRATSTPMSPAIPAEDKARRVGAPEVLFCCEAGAELLAAAALEEARVLEAAEAEDAAEDDAAVEEDEENAMLEDEDGATREPLPGSLVVPLAWRVPLEMIDMLKAMSDSESSAFW